MKRDGRWEMGDGGWMEWWKTVGLKSGTPFSGDGKVCLKIK
jgi:hypothetical protein